MDAIFKMAIAILQIMDSQSEIEAYISSLEQQTKAHISELSVTNLKAYTLLHALSLTYKELYLDIVKNGAQAINQSSMSKNLLQEVSSFVDDCITNLQVAQYYIEDSLGLEDETLDLFSPNDTEKSLNLSASADTDPVIQNFFTSRQFALYHSSIIKKFSDFKRDIEDGAESMKQGVVIHSNTLISGIAELLQAMTSYYNMLVLLKKAGLYAKGTYETYGFTSRSDAKTFANRPYAEIKGDLERISI